MPAASSSRRTIIMKSRVRGKDEIRMRSCARRMTAARRGAQRDWNPPPGFYSPSKMARSTFALVSAGEYSLMKSKA